VKSLLVKINNKLNAQGGFLKAVSVLVGGTAFAQGVSILALPILTRLYNPAEFAIFAVYTSLLMTLMVGSCLRFEIAISIPEDDKEAIHLVLLSLISNSIISLLVALIIWLFHAEIIIILKQPGFSKLIWLLPIGIFFSGIYNTLQYWITRKKQFKLIAKTRVLQSLSGTSIQLIMGVMGFSSIGLILGQIIKVSAGIKQLAVNFYYETNQFLRSVSFSQLKQTFKKYDQFPKYSTFEGLANAAGIQLPLIIIAALAKGPQAGYLMLAMQIMAVPMRFIGGAVSQVYLAQAPKALEKGEIGEYTVNVLMDLLKYGVSILIVIGVVSPLLVKYIFGNEWAYVGILISWMIPWFIFQLLSSPISMIMHISGKQKEILFLTVFGFVLKIGALYAQYNIDPRYLLENYTICSAIFYGICFFVFSKAAKLNFKNYIFLVKKTLPLLSVVSGLVLLLVVFLRGFGL
jgi:Membrane protein involved in the export of O-antigen and teichoic acid